MNKNAYVDPNKGLRKRSIFFRSKKEMQWYSMCAIPMLLVFVFNYIPMFGIIIAFKDYRYDLGILKSEWVGLENFKVFLMSDDFFRITYNTVFLNGIFIIMSIVCALMLAVVLFEIRSRWKVKIYQTMLIIPHFMSWVVVGYIAYAFMSPQHGFLTKILNNILGTDMNFYSRPELWPAILTIVFIWKHVGMDSVMYYSALVGVDSSLFESARIDGANKWQEIRYIMIPQIMPLISILFITKIGGIFRSDFGLFYQITRDVSALYETTDVMDTYIFRVMRVLGDMQISSAAGLLQSVVGFCCVMLANFIIKKMDPDRALF